MMLRAWLLIMCVESMGFEHVCSEHEFFFVSLFRGVEHVARVLFCIVFVVFFLRVFFSCVC